MPTEFDASNRATYRIDLQPALQLWEPGQPDPTSFVELVLVASECSEDEGEVRDMVDALFDTERLQLRDIRTDQIPSV